MNLIKLVWNSSILLTIYTVFKDSVIFKEGVVKVCENVGVLMTIIIESAK